MTILEALDELERAEPDHLVSLEVEFARDRFGGRRLEFTAYLGGKTPILESSDSIEGVMALVRAKLPATPVSIEQTEAIAEQVAAAVSDFG